MIRSDCLRRLAAGLLAATASAATASSAETPVPRPEPVSGAVISRVSGETIRFVAEPDFRLLALGQDLLAGDLVRTGPHGLVGIVFADRTVIRLHPMSELLVREVRPDGADLGLRSGTLWGRAERDGGGVTVTTPSAAVAIRGTDWAVEVTGELTRLSVYDGLVELSNAFGSVLAREGEQAVARPGRPPEKVLVANRREGEQMLFSIAPANSAGPLASVARSAAEAERSPAAPAAVARFEAGAALLRAGRSEEAAALLDDLSGLDRHRAQAARWMAALARTRLGMPFRSPDPAGSPVDAVGLAFAAALAGDLATAAGRLAEAGDHPGALAAAVSAAIARDRPEEALALLGRLKALAPGGAEALEAEGDYLHYVREDPRGALALYLAALALDPADPGLWNSIGLVRDALDHPLEAEAAFREAIRLAPDDPLAAGNLAILLLDQSRLAEAEALIRLHLGRDPDAYLALRAAGRLALQRGDWPGARRHFLGALAAQPAAAETSVMLAAAAYQSGDRVRAEQELDAAARLDPNDPTVPEIRTVIALDDGRADDAIRFAREAARLRALRRDAGPDLGTRRTGRFLVAAYGFLGLEDWGRSIADRDADPLSAPSQFTQGQIPRPVAGDPDPQATATLDALLVQGLLLDPLAAAERLGRTDILPVPFTDAALTGRLRTGKVLARCSDLDLQGFRHEPLPLAFALAVEGCEEDGPGARDEAVPRSASLVLGARPSPALGLVATLGWTHTDTTRVERGPGFQSFSDAEATLFSAGLGFSLRLGERRVLTGFLTANGREEDRREWRTRFDGATLSLLDATFAQTTDSLYGGLALSAAGATGTSLAGIELARVRTQSVFDFAFVQIPGGPPEIRTDRSETTNRILRGWADRSERLAPGLEAEGAAFLALLDRDGRTRIEPGLRLGLAWEPAPGQRLRAAALHDAAGPALSLAPQTVAGLAPVAAPLAADGTVTGIILRWEGEFRGRFHLSAEHQSLWFENLDFPLEDALQEFTAGNARLHRTELRAEWWVGGGIGLRAALVHAESEIGQGIAEGLAIPGVPDWQARAGITWVRPGTLSASLDAVWTGERFGNVDGSRLGPVFSLDASLAWEPDDKRIRLALDVRNLTDSRIARPYGLEPIRRSVWLTGTVRF